MFRNSKSRHRLMLTKGNYHTPCRDRKLTSARDPKGESYGWYCTSGKHFWTDREDAEKCCHPDWKRCLRIRSLSGYGTIGNTYWLRMKDGQEAAESS